MKSGIYQIINLITGVVYIGSAKHLKNRWITHKWELNRNIHHSNYLQNAWNKYGEEVFEFRVLQYIEDKTQLTKIEQQWINWLDCVAPKGYNINPIAESPLGKKHSEESKLKNSLAHKGRKASDETKAKMSLAHKGNQRTKGRKQTPEEIERRRLANTGKKRSPESRLRLSICKLGNQYGRKYPCDFVMVSNAT